ncbi:complement C1q tumor necrosis factor-related protein 3-like [Littorina saxatilis]|uniref:C1q domain-containing protein n=1 Tax=Littorina saxatilis TaxID=31220 RepID=A0AAN9GKP9_9CAEN
MTDRHSQTFSRFLLLTIILWAVCVPCDTERSRDKRSDDHNPLEAVVSGLSQQVTKMAAQLSTQLSQLSSLQTKFDASQKQVAFLAYNSADPFNVAAAGTLVYNVADINLGGGFDTVTGIFTAPTSGLYVFFINCMGASLTEDEDVGVLVDGKRVCACYTFSKEHPNLGSGLATVHVNAGQRAWVHVYRDSGRDVRGSYWNTFTGFLVKTDD